MAIEQMRRPNKHTYQPQMKYLTIYCVTMQVKAVYSVTFDLLILDLMFLLFKNTVK